MAYSHQNDQPGKNGVYGLLFVPKERRLEPNINKVAQKIISNFIRENIPPLDEKKHAQVKHAAKRYAVGPDANVVHTQVNADRFVDRLNDAKSKTHFGHNDLINNPQAEYDPLERPKKELKEYKDSLMNSIKEHEHNRITKITQPLRLSVSAQLENRIDGGKYYVEPIQDPWVPKFEMKVSDGAYPLPNSTPKVWPNDAQYTYNEKTRAHFNPEYSTKLTHNTWGKPSYGKTLKAKLREDGLEPIYPTLTANVCSKNRLLNDNRHDHSHDDSFLMHSDADGFSSSNNNNYYNNDSVNRNASGNMLTKMRGLVDYHNNFDSNNSLAADSFYTNYQSVNTNLMPSLKPQNVTQISTLQQTLVECGSIAKVHEKKLAAVKEDINKSKKVQKRMLASHAKFLKSKISGKVSDDSIDTTFIAEDHIDIQNLSAVDPDKKPVKINNSNINNDKINNNLYNGSVDDATFKSHDTSYKVALSQGSYERYSQKLSEHLQVLNPNESLNPYRQSGQVTVLTNFNKKEGNKLDPKTYRHASFNSSSGNFNITLRTDASDIPGPSGTWGPRDTRRPKAVAFTAPSTLPARSEVSKILSQVEKKTLVSYDTRIVETGALIKALQAPQHRSPGFPAVIELHRALIDAASVNPNSWTLNRQQISDVAKRLLPWLPNEPLRRLLAAYDESDSGIYRFVRITSACLCACRPAMNDLMLLLNKAQVKKDEERKKVESLKKMKKNKNGEFIYKQQGNEEQIAVDEFTKSRLDELPKQVKSDIFILRMIHGLYEDCDGGVDANAKREGPDSAEGAVGIGMRLSDIEECLACACCSIEDEIRMNKASEELIQYLFDLGQKDDIIHYNNPTSYLNQKPGKVKDKSIYPNCSIAEFDNVSKLSMESHQAEDEHSTVIPGGDSLAWGSKHSLGGSTMKTNGFGNVRNRSTGGGGGGAATTAKEGKYNFDSKTMSLRPNAAAVMKHAILKDLRYIPRISCALLMESMEKFPELMVEFSNQLTKFRSLVKPYTIEGSISYEESVIEKVSYGTRHGSNQSLFRRDDV